MPYPATNIAFQLAVEKLRKAGRTVAQADIPGLWYVDGRELNIGQVFDLARQLQRETRP